MHMDGGGLQPHKIFSNIYEGLDGGGGSENC